MFISYSLVFSHSAKKRARKNGINLVHYFAPQSMQSPGIFATASIIATSTITTIATIIIFPSPSPLNPTPNLNESTIPFALALALALALHPILTPLPALTLLIHLIVIPSQSRSVHEARNLLIVALVVEIGVVVHGALGVVLEGGLVEEVAQLIDAEAGEDAEDFALVVVEF